MTDLVHFLADLLLQLEMLAAWIMLLAMMMAGERPSSRWGMRAYRVVYFLLVVGSPLLAADLIIRAVEALT
jgi:hypothetical protein